MGSFRARLIIASLGILAPITLGACTPSGTDDSAISAHAVSDAGAADARAHALATLNMYRAMVGAAPLTEDDAADAFALVGSQHREGGEAAHVYFSANYTSCNCGLVAENQGSATRFETDDPNASVDGILKAMWDEGPTGPHHIVMISTAYTKVGIGIVITTDHLWLTNDFI
jgi:hypothetical protein